MIQKTITDGITSASLISSLLWLDYVVYGAQAIVVLGGVVIMAMRMWLIWKEVQDRRKKDGDF